MHAQAWINKHSIGLMHVLKSKTLHYAGTRVLYTHPHVHTHMYTTTCTYPHVHTFSSTHLYSGPTHKFAHETVMNSVLLSLGWLVEHGVNEIMSLTWLAGRARREWSHVTHLVGCLRMAWVKSCISLYLCITYANSGSSTYRTWTVLSKGKHFTYSSTQNQTVSHTSLQYNKLNKWHIIHTHSTPQNAYKNSAIHSVSVHGVDGTYW